MNQIEKCERWAKDIRLEIIQASHDVGKLGVHIGSALSCADILAVLYGAVLKYNVHQTQSEERDFFILSKGHAYIGYYATLSKAGFFTNEFIKEQFMTDGGVLPVHPVKNISLGIEFSGGSLGTGMPFAVGKALSLRLEGKTNRVFSLVGDGECNEGSIWEAFMSASSLGLNNLTVVVDCNGLQQDGPTNEILKIDISKQAEACGWNVLVIDGHSCEALLQAFDEADKSERPTCIVAHTIKGKGISFMENDNYWHHSFMSEKQYNQAIEELKSTEQ